MSATPPLSPRKGARRVAEVPAHVKAALDGGLAETVNLVEFLAVDLAALAGAVAVQIGLDPSDEAFADALAMLPALKPMQRHGVLARALYQLTQSQCASAAARDRVASNLAVHASDLARGWAAQWVQIAGLPMDAALQAVHRFAADAHFGVREVAWLSVRHHAVSEPEACLRLLLPWADSTDDRVRRFACELTRPRGVWCPHIAELRQHPQAALALLERLRSDESRYVQLSVGNWLNDASKDQPRWVEAVCQRWLSESPTPATRSIVKRAQRSLGAWGRASPAAQA